VAGRLRCRNCGFEWELADARPGSWVSCPRCGSRGYIRQRTLRCASCGAPLKSEDISKGRAVSIGGRTYCVSCVPARVAQSSTPTSQHNPPNQNASHSRHIRQIEPSSGKIESAPSNLRSSDRQTQTVKRLPLWSLVAVIAVVVTSAVLLFAAFASKSERKKSEFLIHKTKWWKKQKQKYWLSVKKRLDEMQNSFPTVTRKGRWEEVVRETKERFEEESLAVAQKLSEGLQEGAITRFEIPLQTRRRMPDAVERTLSYAEFCAKQEAMRLHLEAARLRRKWKRTREIERRKREKRLLWANPISVSAKELYQAYDDNAVRADAMYKGKVLRVSGRVTDIGRDILGTPYIHLAGGKGCWFKGDYIGWGVQCFFENEDAQRLLHVSKGNYITLIGMCLGKSIGPDVVLVKCKIDGF